MVPADPVVVLAIVDALLVAMFFLFRVLPWSKPGPWRLIWIIASLTASLFILGEMMAIILGGTAVSFEVQGPLFGAILAVTTCFILAYLHGQRATEHALTLALTDDLTQLPNQRAFAARLDIMFQRRQPFSVAYVELEGVREVHELYGPHRRDGFLKAFADLLRQGVAPGDVVGRLGDVEFAALLVGADLARAHAATERVLDSLRALVARDFGALEVGAAMGVVARTEASNPGQLLRLAERAARDARRAGGKRITADV